MPYDSESQRDEAKHRLARLTYLFLALGIEQDEDRMQAWAAATTELSIEQLELGCRKMAREWKTGTPRPAHLIAAVKERRPEDAVRHTEPEGGPWVRLDDMAYAMGLEHLSDLVRLTPAQRQEACRKYEKAMAAGQVTLHHELPKVGAPA